MRFKSATRPLCRYCGKGIARVTTTVLFGYSEDECRRQNGGSSFWVHRTEKPESKAAVQRLVNGSVSSIRWDSEARSYIDKATVWDGETWESAFFCNGTHAMDFGVMVARDRPTIATPAYFSARDKAERS
jgi:hypothetical protein